MAADKRPRKFKPSSLLLQCPKCETPMLDQGAEYCCPRCGETITAPANAYWLRLWRKVQGTLVIAAIVIGAPALIYYAVVTEPPRTGALEGTLTTTDGPGGEFSITPNQCWCADRLTDVTFRGVALISTETAQGAKSSNIIIRIEERPGGNDLVRLEKRGTPQESQPTIVLSKNDCTRFEIDFTRDGRRGSGGNNVDYIWGELGLSCTIDSGVRVEADITFDCCSCDPGIRGNRSRKLY